MCEELTGSKERGLQQLSQQLDENTVGLINKGEKAFILEGVWHNFRVDGRNRSELRKFTVDINLFSHNLSSAFVKNPENSVVVMANCELVSAEVACSIDGLYTLAVDCTSAEFEGGFSGSENSITISSFLQNALEQLVLSRLLKITEVGGACWRIHLDAVVLKAGGCILDTISQAIWATLRTLKLPQVIIDEERDVNCLSAPGLLTCDERVTLGKDFCVDAVPIVVTAAQVGSVYMWDTSSEESAANDCHILQAFLPNGNCVGVQKIGSLLVDYHSLHSAICASKPVAKAVFSSLENQILKSVDKGQVLSNVSTILGSC